MKQFIVGDYVLTLEQGEGAVTLFAQNVDDPSDEFGILEINPTDGLVLFGANGIEGWPVSYMGDVQGNEWTGMSFRLDGTSLDSDNLRDCRLPRSR